MAQQSARRGRKNQMNSSCLEHAFMIWFRSANSHTGPQLHRCITRGRTDGSIRLRADLLQKPLASRGASTDEYTRDGASIMRTRHSPAPSRGRFLTLIQSFVAALMSDAGEPIAARVRLAHRLLHSERASVRPFLRVLLCPVQ